MTVSSEFCSRCGHQVSHEVNGKQFECDPEKLRAEIHRLKEQCARLADRGGYRVEKRKRKHIQSIISGVHEAIRPYLPEWRVTNDPVPRHSERSVLAGQIQKIISTPHPETGGVDPSAISDICEHSRSDTPGCPACALKRKRAEFNAEPGGRE